MYGISEKPYCQMKDTAARLYERAKILSEVLHGKRMYREHSTSLDVRSQLVCVRDGYVSGRDAADYIRGAEYFLATHEVQ